MTKDDNPHNNPYWQEQRDKRDIERILQGKPVSNSNFQITRAPNVYVLTLKLFFAHKELRRVLLGGFLRLCLDLLLGRKPQPPAISEDDPFTDFIEDGKP